MSKTSCSICHKKIDTDVDTNYNVSWYHGKSSNLLIMDEVCYLAKEQEYLDNYEVIWKETEKEGANFIKNREKKDCYAGKKDQNGKILQQQNCPHCQPWKYNEDTPSPVKNCLICGEKINQNQTQWTYTNNEIEKKVFCSSECLEKWIGQKNNPQQPNPLPKPQNNNKGMSTETKIILGVVIIFLIFIIGLIGVRVYKRSRPKTS